MKTKNSFGVLFYLKAQWIKNGLAPLVVRITVDGVRKAISLKHKIAVDKWNKDKEVVTGNDPATKSMNLYINQVRTEINNCYRSMQLDHKMITASAVKNMFLGDDENDKSLLDVIKYHNDTMEGVLAWGLLKLFHHTKTCEGVFKGSP